MTVLFKLLIAVNLFICISCIPAAKKVTGNDVYSSYQYLPRSDVRPLKKTSIANLYTSLLKNIYVKQCTAYNMQVTGVSSNALDILWEFEPVNNVNTVCLCSHVLDGSNKTYCSGTNVPPGCKAFSGLRQQYQFPGLTHNTKYLLCVQAICKKEYEERKCVEASTAPLAPTAVTNLYAVGISSSAIHVSWSVPLQSNGPLDGYVLTYKDPRGLLKTVALGKNHLRSYNITGLQAYESHAVFVQAFNLHKGEKLLSPQVSMENIQTWPKAPSRPQLVITKYSQTALKYRFVRPTVLNGPLNGYRLTWCPTVTCDKDNTLVVAGSAADTALYPLSPWVNYTLKAEAYNILPDRREAVSVPFVVVTQTLPQRVERVTQVTVEALEKRSLKITWKAPENKDLVPSHYEVRWCDDQVGYCQFLIFGNNVFEYTARNLKPFTVYTIRITGLIYFENTNYISGLVFTKTGRTLPAAPSKPTNLRITEISGNSASIQWDEPLEKNGLIDGYQVMRCHEENCEVIPTNRRDTTTTRTFKFSELKPFGYYTFQVAAFNRWPDGYLTVGKFALVHFTADPAAPEAPRNLSVTTVGSTSLSVTWQKPAVANGPIEGYYISWCLVTNNTCNISNSNERKIRSTVYIITGLKAESIYKIGLKAFNVHQGRELIGATGTATGRTAANAPEAPSNLTLTIIDDVNITLTATWKPQSTYVSRYIVSLCNNGTACTETSTNETEVTFDYLAIYTNYSVTVQAERYSEGIRLLSDSVVAFKSTPIRAPGPVRNLTVNYVSGNETLNGTATWEVPVLMNGPLDGYQVTWFNDNATYAAISKAFDVSVNTVSFELLNQNFTVTVAAFNLYDGRKLLGESQTVTTTV